MRVQAPKAESRWIRLAARFISNPFDRLAELGGEVIEQSA